MRPAVEPALPRGRPGAIAGDVLTRTEDIEIGLIMPPWVPRYPVPGVARRTPAPHRPRRTRAAALLVVRGPAPGRAAVFTAARDRNRPGRRR